MSLKKWKLANDFKSFHLHPLKTVPFLLTGVITSTMDCFYQCICRCQIWVTFKRICYLVVKKKKKKRKKRKGKERKRKRKENWHQDLQYKCGLRPHYNVVFVCARPYVCYSLSQYNLIQVTFRELSCRSSSCCVNVSKCIYHSV